MKIIFGVLLVVFIIAVVLAVLFGLYLLYVWYRGYALVRVAPRADMFMCDKGHGPMPKNALINFLNQEFCPICFHTKLSKAERGIVQ